MGVSILNYAPPTPPMAALMRALKPAKAVLSPALKDYKPAERCNHSTVIVGDCLYMWGAYKDDLSKKHNIETERRDSSFVEVLHLLTGRWEQKPTTGDPPLGIIGYAAVAIGNEIFYYGGHCSHDMYDNNVLYSLNVDTLKWRKVVPTNPEDGPKLNDGCGMIAVKIEGEDYLVIIEPYSINIHYFRVASGQWISPKVTGGALTQIQCFNLVSVDDTSAIVLQDDYDISNNSVYRLTFTKGSVVCARIFKGRGTYSMFVHPHRSVLLNSPSGIKLLVIGDRQCETFDINKTNWKKVDVPESVNNRIFHSLSVWNEDTTNTWIIEFGGAWGVALLSDTTFLNIRYTAGGDISVRTYSLREYQEEMGKRRRPVEQEISQKGERERIMEERHQQEIQQLHLQMKERDQQAREREREMERQLQEKDRRYQEIERRLQREKEREIEEMRRQSQERERQLRRELQQFQERERQLQQEVQELRTQNDERERQFQEREQQLQQQLEQSAQQLEEKDRQLEGQQSAWVVNGDEIRMTETVLGNGGYGEVRVATFRGLRVAAKSLHRVILSPYNRQIFSREMEIASKVRHPNLLQFIGATREGNPIILTELMPTSLRKELETGFPLPYTTVLNISLDVACALNYLHLFKPHPIIHRDISSGNVLLQTTAHMGIGWRAKVSDYGSANLQNLIATTENPGNRVYSAPEAGNPREHSPAMDVFSYGVLLIEMSICAIPQPGNRRQDVNSIRRAGFKGLVQRCVMDNCKLRPKMSDIINELTQNI